MSKLHVLTDWYFSKKAAPYWLIVLMDCFFYYLVWLFIYGFFIGFHATLDTFWPLVAVITIYLLPQLIFFKLFHTYSVVVRYSSFVDLLRIVYAVACGTIVAILLHFLTNMAPHNILADTRSVQILVAGIGLAAMMIFTRVLVKYLYDTAYLSDEAPRAFIYGVKEGGVAIAKSIRSEKPAKFILKGFISHDPSLGYTNLSGVKVYQPDDSITDVLRKNKIKAVLIPPSRNEDFRRNQKLQDNIIAAGAKIYMAAEASEWNPGSDNAPHLKEVRIEDLLPREQVKVDMTSMAEELRGKRILITGSAGSIGSEIVRQVASFGPAAMVLIDQAESPQHDIRLQMAAYPDIKVETIVTSVCHSSRIDKLFAEFRPEYVFHAAAYKHVPMMEDNPTEAILNNVYSTKVLADASVKYGTRKFVMISTDKAVNPTNVMGCSKRICEIYVQSLNKAEEDGKVKGSTQFITTRFGNVLGSNGSVIPIFERQIREGGPVTVTDPNIVRFFMLIPEACKLVLEAGVKGHGGEIFAFDMGEPVRIADLAKRLILLSGAKDVKIEYTGLRDGEKLYEEVISKAEDSLPSFHEKIRIARVREYDFAEASRQVEELIATAKTYDEMATVKIMKQIVPEYISNNSVYSVLDKK
ncbi:MAG: polysaccharide biosynthesis protein [Bacteroidales bacterium]|nr:polysaccharide biosynthesis protein [Bacteroidales bacterium]